MLSHACAVEHSIRHEVASPQFTLLQVFIPLHSTRQAIPGGQLTSLDGFRTKHVAPAHPPSQIGGQTPPAPPSSGPTEASSIGTRASGSEAVPGPASMLGASEPTSDRPHADAKTVAAPTRSQSVRPSTRRSATVLIRSMSRCVCG
jgi:hypothetical protein